MVRLLGVCVMCVGGNRKSNPRPTGPALITPIHHFHHITPALPALSQHRHTHPPIIPTPPPHQAKSRMAACRATLQEAARWHQLVREADAGFAGGDMTQVGGGGYFWRVFVWF